MANCRKCRVPSEALFSAVISLPELDVIELYNQSQHFPVMALRGLTVFPHAILTFDAGRDFSIAALDAAMQADQLVLLLTQQDARVDEPAEGDFYPVGTVARVRQIVTVVEEGATRILAEGLYRARVTGFTQWRPYMAADVLAEDETPQGENVMTDALVRALRERFEEYAHLSDRIPADALLTLSLPMEAAKLGDLIASHVLHDIADRQRILEEEMLDTRLEKLLVVLEREIELRRVEKRIEQRVKTQIAGMQKELYLTEQMRAIQKELGHEDEAEWEELAQRIEQTALPEEGRDKAKRELERLRKMNPQSPDIHVLRTWIEWLLDLPWDVETPDNTDLTLAQQTLEQDHYGLTHVKERVLETLAVHQLKASVEGNVLLFVGPPGVGKTSVAKSIARALGRKFVRMSVGGMRDEAEILGHRRTYVGAIPGRIISSLKQAGSNNPVFLLDEVDKMSHDFRGDPASALLEVLDGEQNTNFRDYYLDVPVDLSHVLFLATANTLDTIPEALLDRMEVIELEGYTPEEKLQIAKRHLLPKQLEEHGLKASMLRVTDEALDKVIEDYTREAGVRNLERELGKICRKAARSVVQEGKKRLRVTPHNLEKYLGAARFRRDSLSLLPAVGVATGLAWTQVGGETLSIEVNTMPGSGHLELTGRLGDVMKESAMAAMSYIRAHCQELGIDPDFAKELDIHIHVPMGATPKDGPSAGITMATAMISALTGRPVRGNVAMTGEITLRGHVLPIGGLKEKLLAAHREGITKVLIPLDCRRDLAEVPEKVLEALTIVPVGTLDEVLQHALCVTKGEQRGDQAS